jgi:hypothetical protein
MSLRTSAIVHLHHGPYKQQGELRRGYQADPTVARCNTTRQGDRAGGYKAEQSSARRDDNPRVRMEHSPAWANVSMDRIL